MQRRNLLHTCAALPIAGLGARLFAAPAGQSNLLVVLLRGGYDAASLLVPLSSSFYYEARPNIAIARPSAGMNSEAIALNSDWGLHPALRQSFWPLVRAGQASFVPFAGVANTSRSHFETQDFVELGQPLGGRRDLRSGFLNRLVAVLQGARAISFTDQLPLAFQGQREIPNTSLRSTARPTVDARQGSVIASMYRGDSMAMQVDQGFAVRDDVARSMATEMKAASRNAITAKGFELEARRTARLMREGYNIGFVDVGGWDTHVAQGGASGYLASRLDELGRGLTAFADEMGPAWRNTTVLVLSEFGRTFRENGNRGTDHGHGSVMWVLGGAAKTSPVAGEQVALTPATLFQNRDWPVLNDFTDVMAGIFAQQFGLSSRDVQQVFPGARPKDLQLV